MIIGFTACRPSNSLAEEAPAERAPTILQFDMAFVFSCRKQPLYGFDVADHDRVLAEIDQSLPAPNLKELVNAFPTATRHVAELALGNMKLDQRATDAMKADALGEAHQRFGQTVARDAET
jgi:hypothetical protein